MALEVETGTASATSESYASVADADAFHAARANAAWAALTTPAKEAYLRQATEYMVQVYRPRWIGYRTQNSQALDWPRRNVKYPDGIIIQFVDPNVIPNEVKRACMMLAGKAINGALLADIKPVKLSTRVGSIAVTYDPYAKKNTQYLDVDGLLRVFLSGGGTTVRIGRG